MQSVAISSFRRALLVGAATAAMSLTAYAQGAGVEDGTPAEQDEAGESLSLGVVTVTAQKREERLSDVPIALQAMSGETLEAAGVSDLRDMTVLVPSLRVDNPGNSASVTFTIRGVGQRDVNPIGENNVAVFLDGAYLSFLNTVGQPLYDIERIEVLKGPQGTLFGRNATGGLVSIVSKAPTDYLDGYITAEASSDNGVKVEGAIGGPIAEGVTGRLSVSYDKSDGWLENTTGPDILAKDNFSARAQLQFNPTDTFQLLLSARVWEADRVPGVGLSPTPFVIDANGNIVSPSSEAEYATFCASIGLPNPPAGAWQGGSCLAAQPDPYSGTYGETSFYEESYYGLTANAEWELTDTLTLTSITDYQHVDMGYSANITSTTDPQFQYDIYTDPQTQFSEELRLSGENGFLQWQTGLYYLNIEHDVTTDIDLVDLIGLRFASDYSLKSESFAVFAQGDFSLTDTLTLTLGGRLMQDEKEINNKPNPSLPFLSPLVAADGVVDSRDDDTWSGRAVLTYKPTQDLTIYGGVNRGVKGGGYNSGGVETYLPSEAYYEAEVLLSYEAGFKTTLFDGRLAADGSVFHYDYEDYQAFAAPAGASLRTINVDATIDGAELFFTAVPIEGLTLSAGMTYLDAEQHDVPLPDGTFSDFIMPSAPELSTSASIRYAFPIAGDDEFSILLNATTQTERTIAAIDFPDQRIPGYERLDARITYAFPGEHLSVSAFVNNLTDEYALINRVDFTGLSGNTVDTLDRPRWGGVSVTYRY